MWPNNYDLGFFSAKPNQFFKKIITIGPLGDVVVNEKDISFHKKPEALLPEVFENLRKNKKTIKKAVSNMTCLLAK